MKHLKSDNCLPQAEDIIPLAGAGVVCEERPHYGGPGEARDVGHGVGQPEHDPSVVRGDVQGPGLAAGHREDVEAGGQGEQTDRQLRPAARGHSQHGACARHPEPDECVQFPDGQGPHQILGYYNVSHPRSEKTY